MRPPAARHLRSAGSLLLATMLLALVLVVAGISMMNVAVPSLTAALGASSSEQQWIVDGYTVAFAALLLPAGAIGDRFGRRRALVVGIAIFGLASTELMTKIEPHHHCSSIAPPTSIPRMPPAPANPAHTPTARARSSGGNTLVIVDNVPGMINAAPTPVRTRHPISVSADPANADAKLAMLKIVMPAMSARRRPKRSPIAPAGSRSAARATV